MFFSLAWISFCTISRILLLCSRRVLLVIHMYLCKYMECDIRSPLFNSNFRGRCLLCLGNNMYEI